MRLPSAILSFYDLNMRIQSQRLKIDILPFNRFRFVRIWRDNGCKEINLNNLMIGSQQVFNHVNDIQPLIRSAFQQPEEKIVTINIDKRTFHYLPSDTAMASTFRLRPRYRLGRTWRVDASIKPNFRTSRKGEFSENRKIWSFSSEARYSLCPASIAATGKCTIAATKSTRRRRLPRNYRGDVQTAPTASLTSRSARFAVPMPKRSATVSRSSSVMSPVLPFTERTCGFDQASKSLSSAEK